MKANEPAQSPESLVHKLLPLKGQYLYMGARHGLSKDSLVHGEMKQRLAGEIKASSEPERGAVLAEAVRDKVEVPRLSMRFPEGLTTQRLKECAQMMVRFLIERRGYQAVDFAVIGPQEGRRRHTSLRVLLLRPQTVMDEHGAAEELQDVCDYWAKQFEELKPSDGDATSASDESR